MPKCSACGNSYNADDLIGGKCTKCKKKEIDALNGRALIASVDAVINSAKDRSGGDHAPGKGPTKGDNVPDLS